MALSNDELLYVSSFNNDQVVVFGLDGTYIRTFTGGDMNGPNCVAFDSSGNIYVSSAITDNVIKFDAAGSYIRTITEGQLSLPRSIAFVPVPEPSTITIFVLGMWILKRRRHAKCRISR